ncbi:type III-B CRISPR module RAMP protein Cmr4 [Endozoicomonas sp. 2B-B]
MTTETAFFTLMAETSIHAGASEAEGAVDLPIQREKHTGWPCIFGSGVKGAMRAKAENIEGIDSKTVFGPGPKENNGSDHAGSLLVSDARLLFLPVRSLTGHYRWVSCPALLRRLERDLQRAGREGFSFDIELNDNEVLVGKAGKADRLYLEEYAFDVKGHVDDSVLKQLQGLLGDDYQNDLSNKLAIVSDDNFVHLCQAAVPVHAHIAIESETKTVRDGALWHEESLAPDTVMYMTLVAHKGRSGAMTAKDVMNEISEKLFREPYLQVGGNETTGMGWFKVNPVEEVA